MAVAGEGGAADVQEGRRNDTTCDEASFLLPPVGGTTAQPLVAPQQWSEEPSRRLTLGGSSGSSSGGSTSGEGNRSVAIAAAAVRDSANLNLETSKGASARDTVTFLPHLDGARFVLSVWILADHYAHRASVFVDRANVAVNFFVLASGFVTHWAYGGRDLRGKRAMAQFYVRRIGRVVLTTHLSMCVDWCVQAFYSLPPPLGHTARCFCFVEPWFAPGRYCPNGATWVVAALLPSWLLYPLAQQLLLYVGQPARPGESTAVPRGVHGLRLLLATLFVFSIGPSLTVFLLQGCWLSNEQHWWIYMWPPSQLADFCAGAVVAALARKAVFGDEAEAADPVPPEYGQGVVQGAARAASRGSRAEEGTASWWHRRPGLLSDLAVAAVVLAVSFVPQSGYRVGVDVLFDHMASPLLALFLYGSATAGSRPGGRRGEKYGGYVALALSHPLLAQLGRYSFEVFLFQTPLFHSIECLWIAGLNELLPVWALAPPFLLALWLLSAWYAERLEAPMVQRLKAFSAALAAHAPAVAVPEATVPPATAARASAPHARTVYDEL